MDVTLSMRSPKLITFKHASTLREIKVFLENLTKQHILMQLNHIHKKRGYGYKSGNWQKQATKTLFLARERVSDAIITSQRFICPGHAGWSLLESGDPTRERKRGQSSPWTFLCIYQRMRGRETSPKIKGTPAFWNKGFFKDRFCVDNSKNARKCLCNSYFNKIIYLKCMILNCDNSWQNLFKPYLPTPSPHDFI